MLLKGQKVLYYAHISDMFLIGFLYVTRQILEFAPYSNALDYIATYLTAPRLLFTSVYCVENQTQNF
jgi:hypothetical protein